MKRESASERSPSWERCGMDPQEIPRFDSARFHQPDVAGYLGRKSRTFVQREGDIKTAEVETPHLGTQLSNHSRYASLMWHRRRTNRRCRSSNSSLPARRFVETGTASPDSLPLLTHSTSLPDSLTRPRAKNSEGVRLRPFTGSFREAARDSTTTVIEVRKLRPDDPKIYTFRRARC